jgi:hypothetical protein
MQLYKHWVTAALLQDSMHSGRVMGRIGDVQARQDGPILPFETASTLVVADDRPAPDDLPLTQPGWTVFDLDFGSQEAVFFKPGLWTFRRLRSARARSTKTPRRCFDWAWISLRRCGKPFIE